MRRSMCESTVASTAATGRSGPWHGNDGQEEGGKRGEELGIAEDDVHGGAVVGLVLRAKSTGRVSRFSTRETKQNKLSRHGWPDARYSGRSRPRRCRRRDRVFGGLPLGEL